MSVKSILLASCPWLSVAAVLGVAAWHNPQAAGNQSMLEEQSLPVVTHGEDAQFFPMGPEYRLTREVEELEKYNLRRQRIEESLGDQP